MELEDSGRAGHWGDYNCDIPHWTLKNMFEYIRDNQDTLKTEFITWAGDNSGHNVWDNSNEEVLDYTVNITDTLNEVLGSDSQIPIYPTMGNHDTWPVNVEDFSKPENNYAINGIKPLWTQSTFLTAEEAETFGKYGYYSKPFPFNPKGKVISLNMQACNDLNWWLMVDRQDPGQ